MSFPSEDRHERDLAGVQPRNPSQEMEKHDKAKLMSGVPGVPMALPESGTFHRQHLDQANIKAGKPLQNRPIAPASGSIGGMLPGHLVSGGLPGFGAAPVPGHPLIASTPISLTSMMRVAQPAFSHVPAGAAAGALAGVTPRSTSALRTPTVPPSKPTGLASQTHTTTGQSQGHMPATTVVSSRPSSPGSATSHLATVAVTTSMHQQASDHKQSELREVRPGMVSDVGRRGASPHCPSSVVHAAAPTHASVASGSKVIPVISSPLPQNHPGQKSSLSHLQSHLHPSSVHSGLPVTAVGPSLSNSISLVPTAGVAMSAHSQPSKMLPSNTVSVMPAAMTAQGKVYTHPHHFTAPRQAAIPNSDATMNPVDRLSKPNGSVSPAAVSALHTSTISTVSHLGAASLNSVVGSENRIERTHQALPVASQFSYHPGMASFLYPDALSVHPHAAGLHAQYQQPAFAPLSSITRSQQGVSTSAAAAAAAQVAVAAAAGVNPMHIVDPSRILFQQPALGVGASGMGSLGGVDTPVTGGVMDITGAGIYSVPLLTVPPSAGIQAQLSAQNPNATSPRPSILRKRAIESVRKPPTQLPYTEMMPTNQTEAAASPRSDSTLSAPHSTQNSPKPPSDGGTQPAEPTVTTASVTTRDVSAVNQSTAASPVKIKRESSGEVPVSTAAHTVVVNGNLSLTAANTPLVTTATTTTDAASPRKKPRKQNVVATEDKYGSHVSMGPDSPTTAEERIAKRDEDEDLKFILLKRPKISIVGGYKINTKAAHNHFQRYTDVKVKEERKPSIQEIATQKGIVQRANGWRIQHIAGQMDELISAEQEVLKKMGEFRERIPKVKPGQKTKFQDELTMLNELLQGNIQRSQLVVEQLGDSRKSMIKVLDHRQKVLDIIQKQMNKRNPKKKN